MTNNTIIRNNIIVKLSTFLDNFRQLSKDFCKYGQATTWAIV